MIYNNKEVKNKYKSYYNINKAINNKQLYRIEHGVYSDIPNPNPIIVATIKHRNSIITLNTAFYLYQLDDKLDNKIYLACTRNADKFSDTNIEQMCMEKSILEIGKTTMEYKGYKISIYDKERLLIELIRKKWLMSYTYYKKIINNYRKIANTLDTNKLMEYTPNFYNGKSILDTIMKEVF